MNVADPLAQPVAALMGELPTVQVEDSLLRAAELLSNSPYGVAAVLAGPDCVGYVAEAALLRFQAEGIAATQPAQIAAAREFPSLEAHRTGADAMRYFFESGVREAVVLGPGNHPIGALRPADLFPKPPFEPRPPAVGGMATPFGVYLTTGRLRAGAQDWALAATGAMLFSLFAATIVACDLAAGWLSGQGAGRAFLPVFEAVAPAVLFLAALRSIPLAGIHAAEHQVVHALERGEPLSPEVVSRMPRIHPRCGTNLAAAVTLFLSIQSAPWIPYEEVRLLAAILATLFFWRPLGSLLQYLVTTRPPNARQVEMGIAAGRELLERYRYDRRPAGNPFQRLWYSGMLQVMAGAFAAMGILYGLDTLFGWNLPF